MGIIVSFFKNVRQSKTKPFDEIQANFTTDFKFVRAPMIMESHFNH